MRILNTDKEQSDYYDECLTEEKPMLYVEKLSPRIYKIVLCLIQTEIDFRYGVFKFLEMFLDMYNLYYADFLKDQDYIKETKIGCGSLNRADFVIKVRKEELEVIYDFLETLSFDWKKC